MPISGVWYAWKKTTWEWPDEQCWSFSGGFVILRPHPILQKNHHRNRNRFSLGWSIRLCGCSALRFRISHKSSCQYRSLSVEALHTAFPVIFFVPAASFSGCSPCCDPVSIFAPYLRSFPFWPVLVAIKYILCYAELECWPLYWSIRRCTLTALRDIARQLHIDIQALSVK